MLRIGSKFEFANTYFSDHYQHTFSKELAQYLEPFTPPLRVSPTPYTEYVFVLEDEWRRIRVINKEKCTACRKNERIIRRKRFFFAVYIRQKSAGHYSRNNLGAHRTATTTWALLCCLPSPQNSPRQELVHPWDREQNGSGGYGGSGTADGLHSLIRWRHIS